MTIKYTPNSKDLPFYGKIGVEVETLEEDFEYARIGWKKISFKEHNPRNFDIYFAPHHLKEVHSG